MYQFKSLDQISTLRIAQCFNAAFADYEQPISFTQESFEYYLTASAVDLSLSFGAFCQEQLMGFILNSSGIYQGEHVVFDAGTGVIPEHRGKKVFSALFDYSAQQLKLRGVTRYCLEVLQSNQHAITIYSKKAFRIRREYTVLAATGPREGWEKTISVVPCGDFVPFATKYSVDPSFEHTTHTVSRNAHLYEVRYLQDRAYCIYAKRNGAILQMHYNDLEALEDVLSGLISQYPSAWAKNVDLKCEDVLKMLEKLGFTEVTKQYEMARDI